MGDTQNNGNGVDGNNTDLPDDPQRTVDNKIGYQEFPGDQSTIPDNELIAVSTITSLENVLTEDLPLKPRPLLFNPMQELKSLSMMKEWI